MLRVAIIGASGYTGQELIKLLLRHPCVEITALTSRKYNGTKVSEIFPIFVGETDHKFIKPSSEEICTLSDFVFSCLPHKAAMDMVPQFIEKGKKTVDLSADYRFKNYEVYEKWYCKHTSPSLLNNAVYGLPEFYRSEIKAATLVANPGCYPTSVIFGLAPLLKGKIIDLSSIIVDSKSGSSGAGREAAIEYNFCEINEGFKAYKIGLHRHTPEMEQELSLIAGKEIIISFTPHLLPTNRGILSTIYSKSLKTFSTSELIGIYNNFYQGERFVRIYTEGKFPNISFVKGTNFCDIGVQFDSRTNRIIVISAIDNLVKGASGQAVQNMNIMCGFPEDSGIDNLTLFP
ncbi:MAG: N-acetyl-gamma-glutamyl-phosphate reductase [Pseudomonadota bacterium]